ncbi:MAG TPA: hypothetical protein VGH38_13610, partial [Bryobacteraceae bacterium]
SLAVLVMSASLYVGVRRGIHDFTVIFHDASPYALPPAHVAQAEIVKERVPRGSTILYLTDQPETWQFGLWKRSLYPDYLLIAVAGTALLTSPQFAELRYRYQIRYVLLAGISLSGVRNRLQLPDYPGGIPIALAELEN